ncbi:MAG TPA: TetR family transcriptional regulator [Myxococcota bacterium]|jgi:AcrR family transcriptional regulator
MARPAVREERRAQILDAMYAVVASRGLAGASVSEIAEAAGIARGALHYFFANKDEITKSLMRRLGERYLDALAQYVDARIARSSKSVVADVARWHFKGDAGDAVRRMTVWIDYWGQAMSIPALREVVVEIQHAARATLARALLAQRPDLATLDVDSVRAHGAVLLALVEGGLLQWRIAAATGAPLDRERLGDALAAASQAHARSILAVGELPKRRAGDRLAPVQTLGEAA